MLLFVANTAYTSYESKYPPDKEGEELNRVARVWRVYDDEVGQFDKFMTQEWKDMLDVLLVFV